MTSQVPTPPTSQQSDFAHQVTQEVEDISGQVQQQAVIGNHNHQEQNSKEKDKTSEEQRGDVFSPVPVVGQQAVSGENNNLNQNQNQNQNTVYVNNILDKDLYPFGRDIHKSSQEKTLTELTKPLPEKPNGLPEVSLDDALYYCQELEGSSLLIVSGPDSSTAFSAAYALAENMNVSSKRLFTGEWGTLKKLTTEPSIDIILNPETGEGDSSIVVIDTCEIQTFLDSLIVKSSTAALIKEDLKDRNILCICIATSHSLLKTLEKKQTELSFPHWKISSEQKETSQSRGVENEQQEVVTYNQSQAATSLHETADTLKRTVLYVATFFKDLNIRDFERVTTLLLTQRTSSSKRTVRKIEAPSNPSGSEVSVTIGDQTVTLEKGQKDKQQAEQIYSLQEQEGKSFIDVWEEDAEKILESCHLSLTINEYGLRVIDFSLPCLRDELKKYFQDVKFIEYRSLFRKLIELDLLFDESSNIAKALRDLSISMMLFQPGTDFWTSWLERSTLNALERSENKKNSDLVYHRVADLLRETLYHSSIEDLTDFFLERMVSLKQHSAVLNLSKRLRFSPQFNEYYWFKQSIDRGNEDIKKQAYQLLYSQLIQSNSRIYEPLEKIYAWIPDLETDPLKYSPSNKYALQLLLEYSIETLRKFQPELYGKKPFDHPLFGGLRSGESVERRLRMVIEWLLHPGMNYVTENVDSLGVVSILIFPGLFTILFGLKDDAVTSSTFISIVDSLLMEINYAVESYEKQTNIEYQTKILEYWRNLSEALLVASSYAIMIDKDLAQGDFLNQRRNIIDYLIEKTDF